MAPVRNARAIFNKPIESGYPVPGETVVTDNTGTIDIDAVPLNGGYLLKALAISVDPYFRGKLAAKLGKGSYSTLFKVGQPIVGFVVGKIVRSESDDFKVGDHVTGALDFAEYQVVPKEIFARVRKLSNDAGIPWSAYVGVAGMPGRTAWAGWKEVCAPKKGETIYVSTAAGAVGSVVVQLAKLEGLKVIASAGQEDKLTFLRDIGADVVFNYKETSVESVLQEHGPVDIYWDHVGGETLEAVLYNMNLFGRIVIIGQAASYNQAVHPIPNIRSILDKRVKIQGVLVGDYEAAHWDEFYKTIPPLIKEGKIKYAETAVRSLDETGQLIYDVQKGTNTGKAVIVLADE